MKPFLLGEFMIDFECASNILSYDPDSGIIYWKDCINKDKNGNAAGCVNGAGYVCITIFQKKYLAHRLAWLLHYGTWPSGVIDHLDHNKINNRISNLRDVSVQTNNQNKIASIPTKNRTSEYLGVYFDKKRNAYLAKIGINKKQIHLGYFDTPEEASVAYIDAKRKHHEGCTI